MHSFENLPASSKLGLLIAKHDSSILKRNTLTKSIFFYYQTERQK